MLLLSAVPKDDTAASLPKARLLLLLVLQLQA